MTDTRKSGSPTEEQIRQRAYEFYLGRGCEDGHDLSDWIEAELELSQATAQQATGTQKGRAAVSG